MPDVEQFALQTLLRLAIKST